MQKIRCPHCGVVNLEKFLTYPQCAGCGSTLPVARTVRTPFWKRRLGVLLWISIAGGAMAGLVIAASLLATPRAHDGRVLIYGNLSRRVAQYQTVVITMTLDTVSSTRPQRNAMLEDVRVRLPRALLRNFAFVSLEPAPDQVLNIAGRRYMVYNALPRDTVLRLRLYALKPGSHSARISVYTADYEPGTLTGTLRVSPRRKP